MPKNKINFEPSDYKGLGSTLCTGCGHDSVTQHIQAAYFKSSIHPFRVAKISGIGCSSKTTAYFMKNAHGFNTIHGRMAPVATGAKFANRDLHIIGISGDGDSASIGMSGFIHLMRRNVPMVYILENNGVYGLTKGQFSATADEGVPLKGGETNQWTGLDLCALAIESGCTFVARSFSGDGKQLTPLIQAAIAHNGTAFIDVISPCITYANHEGSTKSYDYVKSHKVTLQQLGYISESDPIESDFAEGEVTHIQLANGSQLLLRKLASNAHDTKNALAAISLLHEARKKQEILTGLIYHQENATSALDRAHITKKPLHQMTEADLRPSAEALERTLKKFM